MMIPKVSMREALADPQLLGNALPGESWALWRVLLMAAMGEVLTDDERVLFTSVTGREREPLARVDELWCVVGRRGGKTRSAGTLSAYIACLCDHSGSLAPGERASLPIMSVSTDAARAFQAVVGILEHSPLLSGLVQGDPTADTVRLSTMVDIEVRPANFRTIRGATSVAAIADEVAFWHIEGAANPDIEVLEAVRPGLITTGGPLMVISSPYARRGELYNTYRRDFGPNGDPLILVAQGASKVFNSDLPQKTIDRAYARDPARAGAEYGAIFRTDVESLLTREAIAAVVDIGMLERPRIAAHSYHAFVDPSGGSADSMTMAIGHSEDEKAVVDLLRERRPPFSPESVVTDFVTDLKAYGITTVYGDRYAGEWPREQFRKLGVQYEVSEKTKSDLYRDMVPLINSRSCALIDNERLTSQLIGLERRTARGGRDSIDHAPGGHDDVANAVAGVLSRIGARSSFTYNMLKAVE